MHPSELIYHQWAGKDRDHLVFKSALRRSVTIEIDHGWMTLKSHDQAVHEWLTGRSGSGELSLGANDQLAASLSAIRKASSAKLISTPQQENRPTGWTLHPLQAHQRPRVHLIDSAGEQLTISQHIALGETPGPRKRHQSCREISIDWQGKVTRLTALTWMSVLNDLDEKREIEHLSAEGPLYTRQGRLYLHLPPHDGVPYLDFRSSRRARLLELLSAAPTPLEPQGGEA